MPITIAFSSHKDGSGYRLVKGGSLSGGKPPFDVIMPNGGERILIRPIEMVDMLYMIFANVKSVEGLLEFVEKFGLLGDNEGEQFEPDYHRDATDGSVSVNVMSYEGMPVSKYLKQAAIFLEALDRKKEGPEQLAEFLKSTKIPGQSLAHLYVIPDKILGAQFQIVPADLMQALWFQLGQVLASNIKLSTCLQCGKLFEVGVGAGRRADAKYCSIEHRTLYHSLNRKPAKRK